MSDREAIKDINAAFVRGLIGSTRMAELLRGLTLWPAVTMLEVAMLRVQMRRRA